MKNTAGGFDNETLEGFYRSYGERLDFSEDGNYDFARCQRPDGSVYGTKGQCRKGKEVGAKEEKTKTPKATKTPKKKEDASKEATTPKSNKTDQKKGEVKQKPKESAPPSIVQSLENKVAKLEKAYKEDQSSLTKGELEQAKRDLKERIAFEARTDHYRKLKEIDRRQEEAMKSMSETDLKAITDYTKAHNPLNVFGRGRSYKNLNSCVRKKEGCKNKKQNKHAEELDTALNKMPKNEDKVPFYRGVPVGKNTKALYDMLKNAKPGTTMKDPGYGSYSSSDGVARSFGGAKVGGENREGKRMILFVNKSQEIRPINKASAIKEENEGILPRGTTSTIRRVTEDEQGNLIVEVD